MAWASYTVGALRIRKVLGSFIKRTNSGNYLGFYSTCQATCWALLHRTSPDPREDPKSRSPNLGPCTTKGTL